MDVLSRAPEWMKSGRMILCGLLAALVLGALAACSQPADTGIPSASVTQATPSSEGNSVQAEPAATVTNSNTDDPADAALTYSQCMRANGMPDFPDADAEGRIRFSQPIDRNSPELQQASEACRHLAPPGWGGDEAAPGDMEVMVEFARCMREHGLPDYPDPDPNRGLHTMPNDPQFHAALESCETILHEGGVELRIGG